MVLCTCACAHKEQKNFYISNSSTRKCFKLSMIFFSCVYWLLVHFLFLCTCINPLANKNYSLVWFLVLWWWISLNNVFIYSTILLYKYSPFVYRIGTYLTNCHKIFSRGREYVCVSYLSNTIHLNSLIK